MTELDDQPDILQTSIQVDKSQQQQPVSFTDQTDPTSKKCLQTSGAIFAKEDGRNGK